VLSHFRNTTPPRFNISAAKKYIFKGLWAGYLFERCSI
jgi:hypothetical protein